MKTTLNEIRNSKQKPCKSSWEKLLTGLGKTAADDEPIEMDYILDTLGLADTHWVLCASKDRRDISAAHAANCAERVLHIFENKHPDDNRPRLAIEAARNPNMSKKDKHKAASTDAAAYAADAAASSAYAASAAYAAASTSSTNAAASAASTDAAASSAYAAASASSPASADGATYTDARNREVEWQTENLRQLMSAT